MDTGKVPGNTGQNVTRLEVEQIINCLVYAFEHNDLEKITSVLTVDAIWKMNVHNRALWYQSKAKISRYYAKKFIRNRNFYLSIALDSNSIIFDPVTLMAHFQWTQIFQSSTSSLLEVEACAFTIKFHNPTVKNRVSHVIQWEQKNRGKYARENIPSNLLPRYTKENVKVSTPTAARRQANLKSENVGVSTKKSNDTPEASLERQNQADSQKLQNKPKPETLSQQRARKRKQPKIRSHSKKISVDAAGYGPRPRPRQRPRRRHRRFPRDKQPSKWIDWNCSKCLSFNKAQLTVCGNEACKKPFQLYNDILKPKGTKRLLPGEKLRTPRLDSDSPILPHIQTPLISRSDHPKAPTSDSNSLIFPHVETPLLNELQPGVSPQIEGVDDQANFSMTLPKPTENHKEKDHSLKMVTVQTPQIVKKEDLQNIQSENI